jgi:hypothetical protein
MMRKVFFLTLACLIISFNCLAQLSIRGHLGINAQKIDFETIHGQIKGSTGLSIGLDAQLGNKFYFQPGINYSSKKLKIEGVGEISANKINVPIIFGLRLLKPQRKFSSNVRFFVGPNISTTISENFSSAITDISKDDLKDFNLDATAGVGVDLRIFFIDLGYKYGLNDYLSKNGKSTPLNSFFVNLGIRF